MTLPISAAEPHLYTVKTAPSGAVYHLEIPTPRSRAKFQRDVTAEGLSYPGDSRLIDALRKAVAEMVEPSQQGELIEILDQVEAMGINKARTDDPDLLNRYWDIESQLKGFSPEYVRCAADRAYWLAMYPILAVEHFVTVVEGLDITLERKHGKLTDASINQIPPGHLSELGWEVVNLMQSSPEQVKNSDSPSPSAGDQEATTAG